MTKRSFYTILIAAAAALGFSTANAAPVTFEIIHGNGGGVYSLIHDGAGPSGGNWRHVAENQSFTGQLNRYGIRADREQAIALSNGETFTIHRFHLDLDGNFGIPDTDERVGRLVYSLTSGDSVVEGVIVFSGQGYTSIFNSAGRYESGWSAYLWGGDSRHNLGIDLGIHAVPEPTTLLLLGAGMIGLMVGRRRFTKKV